MNPSIAEAITSYGQHLRRRNLADRTRIGQLQRLRLYARHVDPQTVQLPAIEEFLDARDLSPRARLDYVGMLAGFHRWLVTQGVRDDDPTVGIVRPKLSGRLPRPITDKDLAAAFHAARGDRRMTCWLALAAYAGLRVHEIAGLTWNAINFDEGLLILTVTKGSKPRVVPMATAVTAALEAWSRELVAAGGERRGPVFPAMIGGHKVTSQPVSRITVTNAISRFLRYEGINATAHQLRHWFGTETYRRTKDIRLVGDLLGHTDLRTTALYVKLVPSDEAVAAIRSLSVASVG